MENKINFKKAYLILIFPIALIIKKLSYYNPEIVEKIYSSYIYRIIISGLSRITGLFPFSIAELLLFAAIIFVTWKLVGFILLFIKKKQNTSTIINSFINLLILIGIVYFIFIAFWGVNYYRLPFSNLSKLDVKPSSTSELYALCEDLAKTANSLRKFQIEDSNGVTKLPNNIRATFKRANLGYENASKLYPVLSGNYGTPKSVIVSPLMSYTGITGFYFPYTAEANINISAPSLSIPATVCHEMAHQRGFAREDEANFIAYLTCLYHPGRDFQYSGTILALLEASNALSTQDMEAYKKLTLNYSEEIKLDLNNLYTYWSNHEGFISDVSNKINDSYLKSNNQTEGVRSYGQMVDLLLAEYRQRKLTNNNK